MPMVLSVGAPNPRKNLSRLVAAFLTARRNRKVEHQLVIAGPGTDSLGSRSEAVKCLGYVPKHELVKLYNAADFFLFPSLYEGFGIPIIEAMSCGTPVVTSDRGAMKEVAADAAALVDPYDTHAMSDTISELATNQALLRDLRRRGTKRAKMFSWEKAARETLAVFERAIQ